MPVHSAPRAGMTLKALQSIVRRLSNQSFVRYWIHWNHPIEAPWEMAIALRDYHGSLDLPELEQRGFRRIFDAGQAYYLIPRLDDNGDPFITKL